MTSAGIMLFHRDFCGYSGGHGKVWDYFNHALAAGWDARVFLTPDSLYNSRNPWLAVPERIVDRYDVSEADALFVGGEDWRALAGVALPGTQRVFNLIQGMRHADPLGSLVSYLCRPAIRICVSPPVADAIRATGLVNGPIYEIPAALNMPRIDIGPRSTDVFIDGSKHSTLAQRLADKLLALGHSVRLITHPLSRPEYLAAMADARIAVTLPLAEEGFYLPALEAMALGCAVIVPDAIGNRAYLLPEQNALVPSASCDDLLHAVHRLARPSLRECLVEQGFATAERFSLARERAAFHAVLSQGIMP